MPFVRKMFDGRNFQVIVDDIRHSNYDLVVMGALGLGAVRDSVIGSVCERVIRRTQVDTLVLKQPVTLAELPPAYCCWYRREPVLCRAADGHRAWQALQHARGSCGVYDPFLHYVMFNGIVGVLSEKAAKVFKFKEQEALHEEIIDTGLAKICNPIWK